MMDGAEYYSSASESFPESLSNRKKSSKKKRRFSDDQIRSLEMMFESDTKLEPRKKAEVAKELGLQPRQIAIWFQNKRARGKSKQIEKDYSVLLANYNHLASQYEWLKKENESLLFQLQKLKNEMSVKPKMKNDYQLAQESSCRYGESKTADYQVKNNIPDEENELLIMVESESFQWWH